MPPHVRVPEDLQFWLGDGEEPPPPPPPEHMWVPMSGSSLHLPLMQISWPLQSFAWAIAGGYGTCREREGDDIED